MVQCFDIAAHRILFGADVCNDGLGDDIPGVNNASQIQTADHVLKIHPIDLCDDFCFGNLFGMESQKYVLLVNTGQWNERFNRINAFLLQQIFVCAISVDNGSFWKKLT